MNIETKCEGCKYYVPHYIITEGGLIEQICTGHCIYRGIRNIKKNCEDYAEGSGRFLNVKYMHIIRELTYMRGLMESIIDEFNKITKGKY